MNQALAGSGSVEAAETAMREALAQGDGTAGTVVPILRHLLASHDNSLFGEEILARMRGMTGDIARQLLDALVIAEGDSERHAHDPARIAEITENLYTQAAFLGHLHALSLEWQLTERLQARLSLDPVLSPLLQALIASPDEGTAALAMNLLAAQARFCQAQRRMQLPLAELPGDLLHGALLAMRGIANSGPQADDAGAAAEATIRAGYDEAKSRLGLAARLVTGMRGGAVAALAVSHAGVALFATAVAIGAGLDRDRAVLSTGASQCARLALALRAAGLKPPSVADELLAIHADFALPEGFERIDADRAAGILALADGHGGA